MPPPETRELRIGFVPLTDCAPLVVALERGFFAQEGLEVTLVREQAWATIRDKVVFGELDLAQMLAPMPLGINLGLGGLAHDVIAPLVLDLNGNAITVSTALFAEMEATRPGFALRRPIGAEALAAVIARRRAEDRALPVLAAVFPRSTHLYQLRYWLAAGGVDPDRDVTLVTVPPPQMVERLAQGEIDGCCVGEPWNGLAVRRGVGRLLVTSYELWNNAAEKVLGCSAAWAEAHPATLQACMRALIRAGLWLDDMGNRLEAAGLLAQERYVGVPAEILGLSLMGWVADGIGPARFLPDMHVFSRYAANLPWLGHQAWLARAMLAAGQLDQLPTAAELRAVTRPELARAAFASLGLPAPDDDLKEEGGHATAYEISTERGPLLLGPDLFLDGSRLDAGAALHNGAAA